MSESRSRDSRPARKSTRFRTGRLDVDSVLAPTFGIASIQLLVFRPGTTATERAKVSIYCWLVTRKMWFLLAVFTVLLAPPAIRAEGLWWSLMFGALATATLVAVAWLLARPTLLEAHQFLVTARGSRQGSLFFGDLGMLERYTEQLAAIESADLSPVDHEMEWARIYDEISDATRRARSNS